MLVFIQEFVHAEVPGEVGGQDFFENETFEYE